MKLIIFKGYFGCNRRQLFDMIADASDETVERFMREILELKNDRASEGSASDINEDDEDLSSVSVVIGSDLDYPSNYGSGDSESGERAGALEKRAPI